MYVLRVTNMQPINTKSLGTINTKVEGKDYSL